MVGQTHNFLGVQWLGKIPRGYLMGVLNVFNSPWSDNIDQLYRFYLRLSHDTQCEDI